MSETLTAAELAVVRGWLEAGLIRRIEPMLPRLLATAEQAAGLDEIAETFHNALCTVSHHDKPEVYRAAMGHDQPCRVRFARIAAQDPA